MTDLVAAVTNILKVVEIAAQDDGDPNEVEFFSDAMGNLLSYYEAVIARANGFLDADKDRVFSEVLSLSTRGDLERAMKAYDMSYLMGLGLSMEATSELAYELIQMLGRYRLPPPNDWVNVAKFNTNIGIIKTKIKHVRKVPDL